MFLRKMLLSIIVYLVVLTRSLSAQISVQGVVQDKDENIVENALVELIDQANSSRVFSSTTDNQGWYSIQVSITGISDTPAQTPGKFNLLQNYPNPFNPATVISYEIPHPAHIRIEIYNVLGQKIKTLFDGYQSNLYGRVVWEGTNEQNMGVAAGVYIYSLVTDECRINRKMLLLDGHAGSTDVTGYVTSRINQPSLEKIASSMYTLRVSGTDIINKELYDLQLTDNIVQDVIVIPAGSMTDIDGNVYKTVKIGEQVWMAENLKVTHYRNGEPIPNVTGYTEWANLTSGAYCYYDNNPSYAEVYGALYNWYTVNDNRNIAPAGWHAPTDEEWKQLEIFLGMSQADVEKSCTSRGTNEGNKLKECGFTHWDSANASATNESGFTALPGGNREWHGGYNNFGYHAFFWCSTTTIVEYSWNRYLFSGYPNIVRQTRPNQTDFSVRLLRDN